MSRSFDSSADLSIIFSSRRELRNFVSRLPKRSREEQLKLGWVLRNPKASDEEKDRAMTALIESGMCLLLKHIRGTENADVFENCASEGLLGLAEAAASYDPAVGTSFTTYAFMRVFRNIGRGNRKETEVIRKSEEVCRILKKIRQFENEKRNELGPYGSFSEQELAARLKESEKRVREIRSCPGTVVQMVCSSSSDEKESKEYEHPCPASKSFLGDNDAEIEDSAAYIIAKVNQLPAEDSKIVKMSFGLGEYAHQTQKAIAEKLHRTTKYVSSRLNKSLEILKRDRNLQCLFGKD